MTKSATEKNIETGVFLKTKETEPTLDFLHAFMRSLKKYDPKKLIYTAMLAHFRSEILFLALEESKVKQSITQRPHSLRNIFPSVDRGQQGEETIDLKIKNSLSVSILRNEEKTLLLEKEKALKESIREHFAIKLDSYGWISSAWTLQSIVRGCHPINTLYSAFLEAIIETQKKISSRKYRFDLAETIKKDLDGLADDVNIIISEYSKKAISTFTDKFSLKVENKKSPYRKFNNLCNQIKGPSNILSILNPYKIGADDELLNNKTVIDLLSADQINLSVMCELAIKIRQHTKRPKPPSVWWFDVGLDEDIFESFGYDSITPYRERTCRQLRDIIDRIQSDPKTSNLYNCLEGFCEVTGFNLGMKYPSITNVQAWLDDDEEQPYAFIIPGKQYYNPDFNDENIPSKGIILSFDQKTISKEWHLEEQSLIQKKGTFKLGSNLRLYFDEETKFTYLYVDIENT